MSVLKINKDNIDEVLKSEKSHKIVGVLGVGLEVMVVVRTEERLIEGLKLLLLLLVSHHSVSHDLPLCVQYSST